MPTVVIIHAAEDTLPARALAEKLRQAKLDVTLERQPGDETREAAKSAAVTIALWSPRSVGQAALIDDVSFVRGKSKVVHASMQSAAIPDQFRNEDNVNLTGWRGEDEFQPWRDMAQMVTSKAGVAPLPPPAPRPSSGFFQPGAPAGAAAPRPAPAQQRPAPQAAPQQAPQRAQPQQPAPQQQRPAPQPQAPRPAPQPQQQQARPAPAPRAAQQNFTPPPQTEKRGGGNMMLIGIITFVVVALAGGGGYWFLTQNQGAQTTSLEEVDLGSASELRAFLASNPSAEARAEAQEALATLEQQSLDAARDANTIEAFEAFLRDFPESDEAIFVQGQIQQLRLTEANGEVPPVEGTELPPTETPDPDLVPPTATAPTPGDGPASLTPPAEEPAPEPSDAPTN